MLVESEKEAQYRSCPANCQNQYSEFGCSNPAHQSDPGWLLQSLEKNLVQLVFGGFAKGPDDVVRLRAIAHKPWVRSEIERFLAHHERQAALAKELLAG